MDPRHSVANEKQQQVAEVCGQKKRANMGGPGGWMAVYKPHHPNWGRQTLPIVAAANGCRERDLH